MAIGSIGSYTAPLQGYFNSNGTLLNKYMTSLHEQKKAASQNYFNQSLFQGLGKVSSASSDLRAQVAGMSSINQYSSSVGKAASYSDKDVLSADVSKNAVVSGFTKTDVTVSQLASAQENKSDALKAGENSFGDSFSLKITDSSGKTSSFSVNLTSGDNNKAAMQSMAEVINKANAGVKATVTEDKESGTVRLELEGTKTGATDGKFTVTDTSPANMSVVSKASQNAQYSVNGVNFESQSNDKVKIMDGVTANLKKTGSTQITYQADASAAVASVQKFVDSFNNLRSAASGFSPLMKQLDDVARNYSRAMGFSGIGMDKDGKLSIVDSSKLSSAVSDGSFSKNFQGVGSLGSKLTNIASNSYRTAYSAAVEVNFKELMNSSKPDSSNNWQFDLSLTSGLLFNMRI